jgi:hypothetical protein
MAIRDHRVEGTETEGEVSGQRQLGASNLASLCHFQNHEKQERLVWCRVAASAVNLQCREFVEPV